MAGSNWRPIGEASLGLGDLLLRCGSGSLDPVFVGQQRDDGLWYFGNDEVRPLHFCLIPQFDFDGGAAA
jgi:hypothetical protein